MSVGVLVAVFVLVGVLVGGPTQPVHVTESTVLVSAEYAARATTPTSMVELAELSVSVDPEISVQVEPSLDVYAVNTFPARDSLIHSGSVEEKLAWVAELVFAVLR